MNLSLTITATSIEEFNAILKALSTVGSFPAIPLIEPPKDIEAVLYEEVEATEPPKEEEKKSTLTSTYDKRNGLSNEIIDIRCKYFFEAGYYVEDGKVFNKEHTQINTKNSYSGALELGAKNKKTNSEQWKVAQDLYILYYNEQIEKGIEQPKEDKVALNDIQNEPQGSIININEVVFEAGLMDFLDEL